MQYVDSTQQSRTLQVKFHVEYNHCQCHALSLNITMVHPKLCSCMLPRMHAVKVAIQLYNTCMEHSTMVTATTASCRVTPERNISLAWAARTNHFLIILSALQHACCNALNTHSTLSCDSGIFMSICYGFTNGFSGGLIPRLQAVPVFSSLVPRFSHFTTCINAWNVIVWE